jgi:ABC-2 type transport system ATP-binding protein
MAGPAPQPPLAIEARDVVKTFHSGWLRRRATPALRGASLAVQRGEIFGLLGPNGAGKTTLLSILATLLVPDGGVARVLGLDVTREAAALRRRINMASGRPSFLWSLRVEEIIAFYGRLYGLSGAALRARVDALVEQYELRDHRRAQYNELSTGLKQRVALAKALVNEPELLFLDEPTLGLDPDVSVRVRRHIADLRRERGMTIVLTTHYMREAEELCDEIGFIKAGRILARGTADGLKRQMGLGEVVALRLDPRRPEWLAELAGVLRVAETDGWLELTVDHADKRVPELLRALAADGVEVRNLQVREPQLEDVFVELAR